MTALKQTLGACKAISRPDVQLTTDRSPKHLLMAVNRRLPKERLNLDPGLNAETKSAAQSHLKLF